MQPYFEIKYLELKWYDQDTLTKITESMNSLNIDYDDKSQIFQTETTIYPKINDIERGHLAIRFLNKKADTPYILMATGEKKYLSKIQDPNTDFTWWILKEKWNNEHHHWVGIASNIVGSVRIMLQSRICELTINGSDFTYNELEKYLQTFKNDLWELILDESSAVEANGRVSHAINIDKRVIDCVSSLVIHAERILKNSKVELREIQAMKPRKSVRPVNRTFMELATKSNQRYLTSRASEPSYNVAENRYIFFALERSLRIISQIVMLSANKMHRYQDMMTNLQSQYDSFKDHVKIHRDLVVRDLKKIKERTSLEYWKTIFNKQIEESNIQFHLKTGYEDQYFKIENKTQNRDGFFVVIWDGIRQEWVKQNGKLCFLNFSVNLFDLINILQAGMVVYLNGEYIKRESEKSVSYIFSKINNIELWDHPSLVKAELTYNRQIAAGKELAANQWIKALSKQEIEEQEKEKIALRNRINFYEENQKLCTYVFDKLKPKLQLIKEIIKQFHSLNIKSTSFFPNSMTFVQNPHYQGVHNSYQTLRNVTNLQNEDLLLTLERVDKVGLINMPLLYERWVLLQIIMVLKEVFRFTPQNDWKSQLMQAVTTNQEDIKIVLANEDAKRYISLWYEKKLPNNKRPDFTLDLTWYPEIDSEKKEAQSKRFILDAKFYDKNTFIKAGGMMAKIEELYTGKNYSENNQNPVFLIHPCKTAIESQITPQTWGAYSFLGESDILDSGTFNSHNKGAIFLNPVERILYHDELQRLLGMFLQYKLEDSSVYDTDNDRTQAIPICIRCGSTDIKGIPKSRGYYDKKSGEWRERTPSSVWMQCNECEQMQIHNHCSNKNDSRTRLIKNGSYWTYHSALALEPYNMKCPTCGEWGAW